MTTEIEKKFFKAFGIPRIFEYKCWYKDKDRDKRFYSSFMNKEYFIWWCGSTKRHNMDYKVCEVKEVNQITDRILLELICILVKHYWKTKEDYVITAFDAEHLRKEILSDACYIIDGMFARKKQKEFISQVRKLFGLEE